MCAFASIKHSFAVMEVAFIPFISNPTHVSYAPSPIFYFNQPKSFSHKFNLLIPRIIDLFFRLPFVAVPTLGLFLNKHLFNSP